MEGETVIAGVDTHKDVHVLCLLDGLGRKIRSGSFGADPEGYDRLAEAIGDPGGCLVVGVEGTASYGAGLTRRLVELGYNVVEVLRPKRDKARPGEGKSDPLDAERAARKAASGRGCSVPKSQDGWVEAVRQLYVARRLAVATSTSCVACAKSMLTTAPGALRERFRGCERPKDLMPLLARGRKAASALEESVLASLRSVAAVWKEARSQVESCDARIRALLRRANAAPQQKQPETLLLTAGGITLDPEQRVAVKNGEIVELTAKEYDLIELLVKNPRRVYSRENLMDLVWGYTYAGDYRTVDVHIRRLREKLEENPAAPQHILTKWGVGYYLKD